MKIADFFAELGFKIEGADNLKEFDKMLQSIAASARETVAALKQLAGVKIPRNFRTDGRANASSTNNAVPASGPAPDAAQPSASPAKPGPSTGPNKSQQRAPVPPPPAANNWAQWWRQFQARQRLATGLMMPQPPVLQPQQPPLPASVTQGLKSLGMLGLKALGIATLAIAIKKLVATLTDMVRVTMQTTFAVDKFTTQTGISRRELKQWERVAELSDVRAEELQTTLAELQQRSRQIQFTGEGSTPFSVIGVDPMQSPTNILKKFAERTRHMDTATAVFWGRQMGITENMVYMLRKNADRLDQLIPNAELTESEYASVMQLNTAWKEMVVSIGILRDKLVSDLAPAITLIVNGLDSVLKFFSGKNRTNIWSAFGGMALGPLGPMGAVVPFINRQTSSGGNKTEINAEIRIDGSGSPDETAREVRKQIQRMNDDTYYQRSFETNPP